MPDLSWSLILTALFCALVLWAGWRDLVSMTIPNRHILMLAGVFCVSVLVGVVSPGEAAAGVGLALIVLAIGFAFFAFGWIGGGDAKLAAVNVLWFGPAMTANYLLYTAAFGTALTMAMLAFRRQPILPALASVPWIDGLHRAAGVPYGAAMAMGALVTVYLGSGL